MEAVLSLDCEVLKQTIVIISRVHLSGIMMMLINFDFFIFLVGLGSCRLRPYIHREVT